MIDWGISLFFPEIYFYIFKHWNCNALKKMNFMRIPLLAFAMLAIAIQLSAQTSNADDQTYLVTSVTMRIDSVTTVQQMDQIRTIIKSHSEIRDFDIKGEKCNFTMSPSNSLLTIIEQELTAEGYSSEYLFIRDNQTFTSVPFENSRKRT